MFKISESDKKLLQERLDDASNARADLDIAIVEFNQQAKRLFETTVQSAVDDLNLAIEQVNLVTEDIHNEMQEEFDSNTEAWQESDEGQKFADWMSEFDSDKNLDEIEVEEPTEVEGPELELPDAEEILSEP